MKPWLWIYSCLYVITLTCTYVLIGDCRKSRKRAVEVSSKAAAALDITLQYEDSPTIVYSASDWPREDWRPRDTRGSNALQITILNARTKWSQLKLDINIVIAKFIFAMYLLMQVLIMASQYERAHNLCILECWMTFLWFSHLHF